jgi:xanthine dehydrogenase accessory factor
MPLTPSDSTAALWIELARLEEERQPHTLVQLIEVRGSAPQNVGAKMIVLPHGLPIGTVGGGKIEAAAIRYAREILTDNPSREPLIREVEWNLQHDIGMTCGGAVRLLFEARHARPWTVAIFGAGHISQVLIPILLPLPATLLCIDSRSEWLDRLPHAGNLRPIRTQPLEDQINLLPAGTFIVSITQGHTTDLPILSRALQQGTFGFLGCIGSEVKGAKLRSELTAQGHPPDLIARLHCPLGLPLGSNHPQEIAISIAAQLLQQRDALAPPQQN